MQIENIQIRSKNRGRWQEYVNVIKPRETVLLVFIGLVTALVAAGGNLPVSRWLMIGLAVLLASAGANGLTNYLDRNLDARMERTRRRALPSGRLYPAENALYFCLLLTFLGLILAWMLSPWACLADLTGTLAAVIYRKRATCVFPQGAIASCSPVMMSWLAVTSTLRWETLLLCLLILFWLPAHIWSIMLAHQSDYRQAGLNFFPINSTFASVSSILLAFSVALLLASLGLWKVAGLSWLYLSVASGAGLVMVIAAWRLTRSRSSRDAWRLYKLSSFPYLGLIFLILALDLYLMI